MWFECEVWFANPHSSKSWSVFMLVQEHVAKASYQTFIQGRCGGPKAPYSCQVALKWEQMEISVIKITSCKSYWITSWMSEWRENSQQVPLAAGFRKKQELVSLLMPLRRWTYVTWTHWFIQFPLKNTRKVGWDWKPVMLTGSQSLADPDVSAVQCKYSSTTF